MWGKSRYEPSSLTLPKAAVFGKDRRCPPHYGLNLSTCAAAGAGACGLAGCHCAMRLTAPCCCTISRTCIWPNSGCISCGWRWSASTRSSWTFVSGSRLLNSSTPIARTPSRHAWPRPRGGGGRRPGTRPSAGVGLKPWTVAP